MSRRGVWQLTKLTVNYCAHSGSSRGVREFISSDLERFRSGNPQMAVEAALRPGRHPHVLAEYANGHVRSVDLKNTAPEDVAWHLAFLRSEKGHRTSNKIDRHLTSRPSIQGAWTPGVAVQPPPASAHA